MTNQTHVCMSFVTVPKTIKKKDLKIKNWNLVGGGRGGGGGYLVPST